jgi:predicted transcriptional regulator
MFVSLTLHTKYDKVTTMRESTTFTVSLPPAMAKQVQQAMKAEHRTRSELVREALRVYLSARLMPIEIPTAAEARAYREGMAAYRRGDFIRLEEYANGMDRRPHRARAKVSSKNSDR